MNSYISPEYLSTFSEDFRFHTENKRKTTN